MNQATSFIDLSAKSGLKKNLGQRRFNDSTLREECLPGLLAIEGEYQRKRTGSDMTFSRNCVGKKKEKKIVYNFIKEKKNEFAGSFGFIRIQLTREQQLAGIRDGGSGKGLTAVHGEGWCPKGVFRNRDIMADISIGHCHRSTVRTGSGEWTRVLTPTSISIENISSHFSPHQRGLKKTEGC